MYFRPGVTLQTLAGKATVNVVKSCVRSTTRLHPVTLFYLSKVTEILDEFRFRVKLIYDTHDMIFKVFTYRS